MRLDTLLATARRALLLAVALTIVSPANGQGIPDGKLDPVLQARARQLAGRSRVLVEFRGIPDPRVISGSGGVPGTQLSSAGLQVGELDNAALANLAGHPQVGRLRVDHPIFPTLERTGAAVAAVVARQAFKLTGKDIGVAMIDSGITGWHDDLYLSGSKSPRADPRIVHFRDFTLARHPSIWAVDQPVDDFGHGTHVAGVIAGNGFDSDGARMGMAPGANLIGLKVLDADGNGYVSNVIAAIDYAIAIKDTYNIRIINVSVASGVFESFETDPLALAARRAVDAGIVVIAAAGNLGTNAKGELQYGGITCPGNAPWVLTVGASSHEGTPRRSDDVLGLFSSRGPTWIDFAAKPDLVAPAVGTESLSDPHSTLYSVYADYLLDGTRQVGYKPYLSLTGTSMAAPVVTGTVALMLEANPELTPNAVKAILQYTAEVRDGESLLAQGAGLLNVLGAIRMARFFGTANREAPEPGDTIENENIAWSEHIIWGNEVITGGIPLPGANAWALGVTWGAETTDTGKPIVWGLKADNVVWSTRGGDNIVWSTSDDDNIVWSTNDDDNIVWSTSDDDNIVWSTSDDDNIVWSTSDDDNIVWSTSDDDNIVWSTDCGGRNCTNVIWGARDEGNFIWGTASDDDNIVWSTSDDDNIVWSTNDDDNIVWSTGQVEQVLWLAPQPVEKRNRRKR